MEKIKPLEVTAENVLFELSFITGVDEQEFLFPQGYATAIKRRNIEKDTVEGKKHAFALDIIAGEVDLKGVGVI